MRPMAVRGFSIAPLHKAAPLTARDRLEQQLAGR